MRRKKKTKPKPEVTYPPLTLKKWIPPDERQRKKSAPKYKPAGLNNPLCISSLMKVWHAYRMVKNFAILIGSRSQTHHRFHYNARGFQGGANCVIAILYTKIYDCSSWDRYTLDEILDVGNHYYLESKRYQPKTKNILLMDDLKRDIYMKDHKFTIDYKEVKFKGLMQEDPESKAKDYLPQVLMRYFEDYEYGIIMVHCEKGAMYFAVWKYGNGYFMFDPSAHNIYGTQWLGQPGKGTCLLIRFPDTEHLVKVIHCNTLCYNVTFDIKFFSIERVVSINTRYPDCLKDKLEIVDKKLSKPEPPAEESKKESDSSSDSTDSEEDLLKITEGNDEEEEDVEAEEDATGERKKHKKPKKLKAPIEKPRVEEVLFYNKLGILVGTMHQDNDEFAKCKGLLDLCNAVAAIAMLRDRRSAEWSPSTISNVLKLGYRICVATLTANKPDTEIKLRTLTQKIEVNGKTYQLNSEPYGAIGDLNSKRVGVVDLPPALRGLLYRHDCVVIQGPSVMAVWREDNKYYMFDPNERTSDGETMVWEKMRGSAMIEVTPYTSGAACVRTFSDVDALVEGYKKNVPKEKRGDMFILSPITIDDFVQLPDKWKNFVALDDRRWILRGTHSQSDRKYHRAARNAQCTAMAAMAIIYAHLVPLTEWTTATLDKILNEGTNYYENCVVALKAKDKFKSNMLMPEELIRKIIVESNLVCLNVDDCTTNGTTENILKGFTAFFEDNDFGIFTCKSTSLAVMRKGSAYYYFDSHDRNARGLYQSHGRCCALRILDIETLVDSFLPNLQANGTEMFNISRILVEVFQKIKNPIKDEDDDVIEKKYGDDEDVEEEEEYFDDIFEQFDVDFPVYNYKRLTKKRAILRSNINQYDDKFEVNAGKQTIPNLMSAIGMARLIEPRVWTTDILEDVLVAGDKIYDGSMDLYYKKQAEVNLQEGEDEDENDDITTENVVKDFSIGVNDFKIEFEFPSEGEIGDKGDIIKRAIWDIWNEEVPEGEKDNKEFILQTNKLDVVIWKDDQLYYIFDPGRKDEGGNIYGKDDWSAKILSAYGDDEATEMYEGDDEEGFGLFPKDSKASAQTKPSVQVLLPPSGSTTPGTSVPATPKSTVANIPKSGAPKPMMDGAPKSAFGNDSVMTMTKGSVATVAKDSSMMSTMSKLLDKDGEEEETKKKHTPDYWLDKEKKDGRAYIMWFTKPNILLKHLVKNHPPKLVDETNYKITRIRLKNITDAMEPDQKNRPLCWHAFCLFGTEQWILRGTINQTDEMFPPSNRGLQSAANCLMALAFAKVYAISKFTKYTIDEILKYGDRLLTKTKAYFRKVVEDDKIVIPDLELAINASMKTVANILHYFCMEHDSVKVTTMTNVEAGDINDSESRDLLSVLSELFEIGDKGSLFVVTARDLTISVWKDKHVFYMFDPEARGPNGRGLVNGVACITKFAELEKLVKLFLANLPELGSNAFQVFPIAIEASSCDRPIKVDLRKEDHPERLVGMQQILPGKMLVRGSLSQDDKLFARGTNAQSAPIAFVALSMSLVHYVEFWTKPILDNILITGDEIYGLVCDKTDFNPWEEKMTVAKTPTDFKMGKINVNCELRNTIQKGVIDILDPNIDNLRQGMEKFFAENSYGVLECDFVTVAIWEEEVEKEPNYIYMFDPNARGPSGLPVLEKGTCCALRFVDFKTASDHVIALVAPNKDCEFTIIPVEIVIERNGKRKKTNKYGLRQNKILDCVCDKKVGRLKYYLVPGRNFEIIRGFKSQNGTMYSANSRGNQDIANCIVSFVMNRLIPIEQWTCRVIDMILDVGDQLYKDSYMLYNPKEKKLRLETLIRDVIIQNLKVKVSIGSPVMSGILNKKYLTESLLVCLIQKPFCVVQIDKTAVSVCKKEDNYYLFDPCGVDINGFRALMVCGGASVIRFKSLEMLVDQMLVNLKKAGDVFNVVFMAIHKIEMVDVGATFENEPFEPAWKKDCTAVCERAMYGRLKK